MKRPHPVRRGEYENSTSNGLCPRPEDEIEMAAIDLAKRRANVEFDLLGAILADHAAGVPLANSAGITQWHFDQPDLFLIFTAASVAHERDILTVLRVARLALQAENFWDA